VTSVNRWQQELKRFIRTKITGRKERGRMNGIAIDTMKIMLNGFRDLQIVNEKAVETPGMIKPDYFAGKAFAFKLCADWLEEELKNLKEIEEWLQKQ
jgi:hypothetical protein